MEVPTRQKWIRANTREPVVDIACGYSIYYWDDGTHIEEEIEYLGFDLYKEPINAGPAVPDNFMLADAQNIPLPDNSFETAVIGEVIEHCENPVKAIKEAYRVASSRVLLTVTDEDEWPVPVDFRDSEFEHPVRKYDRDKVIEQCNKAGISESDIEIGHTVDYPLAFHVVRITV